jgi:hypothetical protein
MTVWAIAVVVNASCTIALMAPRRGSSAVRDGKVLPLRVLLHASGRLRSRMPRDSDLLN